MMCMAYTWHRWKKWKIKKGECARSHGRAVSIPNTWSTRCIAADTRALSQMMALSICMPNSAPGGDQHFVSSSAQFSHPWLQVVLLGLQHINPLLQDQESCFHVLCLVRFLLILSSKVVCIVLLNRDLVLHNLHQLLDVSVTPLLVCCSLTVGVTQLLKLFL